MSRVLRVERVEIQDRRGWQVPYDLDSRLVGIIGPIDRGKTSMVDCIDYVFGRGVRFRGAVDAHMLAVRVRMRIGDGTFVLQRDRNRQGKVHVWDRGGDLVGRFPIKDSGDEQCLSDWLLAQLELEDTFASVRLPGNKSLDFATDMVPYLHIRQEDIDRFVIRPGSSDAARVIVLKLLLHLTSPDLQRVVGRIRDTDNEIKRKREKAKEIADFLSSSEDTNAETIEADLHRLRDEKVAAAAWLATVRDGARRATQFATPLRERVEQAREHLSATEAAADRVRKRWRAAEGKVNDLKESLRVLSESERESSHDRHRLPFEYSTCPACAGDLSDRAVEPGHCSVCTLLLPDSARVNEKTHLRAALESAEVDLTTVERDARSAETAEGRERDHLDAISRELDEQTRNAVAPYIDNLAAATAEVKSIDRQLSTLERIRTPHRRLAERQVAIDALRAERERLDSERLRLEGRLQPPADVIGELNRKFKKIVRDFDLPWSSGRARLDPDTLAPVVDEQEYDERGGGARTAVSVAYSLALLLHALADPERFHLPTLLIIDSPQKNLGRNDHDEDLAQRIYEQFILYTDQMRDLYGGRYEHFQLIIVDNDIPRSIRRRFKIHEFDADGFIRDLQHPHGVPESGEQLRLGDED